MPSLQDLVGEGNAAVIEEGTRVISGLPIIDVAGISTNSWVARKTSVAWEFPSDAEMFAYGENASPVGFDPSTLALTGNAATYNFTSYRKVKTAAPAAATSIAAATLAAVQSKWIGGAMIKFPMGATGYAITPAGTGYVEHGRPATWEANKDYIALILKFDVPHVFWLAAGTRN